MLIRLISLMVLSSALLSCSTYMNGNDVGGHNYYNDVHDERTANVPMAGNRGLNADMMDYRLSALMAEAQKLDHDMDMLIARMGALHQDIKKHKKQSDAANAVEAVAVQTPQVLIAIEAGRENVDTKQSETSVTNPPAAALEKKPEQKPSFKKEPYSYMKEGVNKVRHGVHKGKTRLVFDVNGSTNHTVDFDKEVGLVTVTMPNTIWSASDKQMYKLQQLSGYEAKNNGKGGSVIALAVKNTSDVKTSTIKKSGTKPARLVVDLMK